MNEKLNVTWRCRVCNCENLDNFGTTVRPACENGCNGDFAWGELVSIPTLVQLNNVMFEIEVARKGWSAAQEGGRDE